MTHPNLLSTTDSVLVIVDVQAKLTVAMPQEPAKAMIANIRALISAANILTIPVLVTEQYPKGLGPTEPAIAELLLPTADIFAKTGFSCCAADGFNATLTNKQRKQIILVGQESHICVLQTALELAQQDYQVHVLEDAVCSRNPEHKSYALQRLQQQGITVSNYESVLFEWLRNANHPDFKSISKLIN